jgi:hypothetical protein
MLLLSVIPTKAERPSGEGALNDPENPDIGTQRERVLTRIFQLLQCAVIAFVLLD